MTDAILFALAYLVFGLLIVAQLFVFYLWPFFIIISSKKEDVKN